jgi:hypothetical protein
MGAGKPEEQLLRLMCWLGGRLRMEGPHTGHRDPFVILQDGRAWCDQHCKVFLLFAWQLAGIDGRELAIYHTDGENGHTVVEMFYLNGWHLFDPQTDHMEIYRLPPTGCIMSYDELSARPEVVKEAGHWWQGKNGQGKEGFYASKNYKSFGRTSQIAWMQASEFDL